MVCFETVSLHYPIWPQLKSCFSLLNSGVAGIQHHMGDFFFFNILLIMMAYMHVGTQVPQQSCGSQRKRFSPSNMWVRGSNIGHHTWHLTDHVSGFKKVIWAFSFAITIVAHCLLFHTVAVSPSSLLQIWTSCGLTWEERQQYARPSCLQRSSICPLIS